MKRVHLGVPGTAAEHHALVPYCEPGFQAWKRGSFTAQTTVPVGITCEHCKKTQTRNP